MILVRTDRLISGIFGYMSTEDGSFSCYTLEHAYPNAWGTAFSPKLATGIYTCVRYRSPKFGYDVFIVQNVPPFQGNPVSDIEIHKGNYNGLSHGCILLGATIEVGKDLLESKIAFDQFMRLMAGVNSFQLSVDQPLR